MLRRAVFALLLFSCVSLACSVQLGNTFRSPVTPVSSVMFIAPANNSVVAEGSTVQLAVLAEDGGGGVGKVEFLIDGVSIGAQVASTPLERYTARHDWRATGAQGHLITAQVSRADGTPIGETSITITVVALPTNAAANTTAESVSQANTATTAPAATNIPATAVPTNTVAPTAETITQPTIAPTTENISPVTNPTVNPNAPLLTVTFDSGLNVRSGPGVTFNQIGKLQKGDTAVILGRNGDSTWWFIERAPLRGWVTSNVAYSGVAGDTSQVPLVASNPTPTANVTATQQPALAPTSTSSAYADLVIDSYTLDPVTPKVNQTFFVTVVVRNQGTIDARASLLSGVFQPGFERSDMAVPAIPAGQSVTLPRFPVTLKLGGPNQTGTLTLDVNHEIDEGSNGEANNVRTITYSVNQ